MRIHHKHHHKKHFRRHHLTLRRDLGLLTATLAGIGIIVGAGIYALIGQAAGLAGNAVWLSFLISAALALFTGFSYAELSSMFPKDAGEYIYVEHAFGRSAGFVIGYLVIIAGIISAAAVSLGFAGYFAELAGGNIILIAALVLLGFSLVNYLGIRQSTHLSIVFTVLGLLGLAVVIALLPGSFGNVDYFALPQGLSGLFEAASLIFFAFLGFESVVKLSEETKNPRRTIPLALLFSIGISTIVYILASLTAASVLGWERLSASHAPLADVAALPLGEYAFLFIAIVALLSIASTALIILIVTSRMLYGVGHEFRRLRLLSVIDKKYQTPRNAIIAVGAVSMLFALSGDIKFAAEVTNFAVFLTFIAINIALIKLRYTMPAAQRLFHSPLRIGKMPLLPAISIIFSLFMIINLEFAVILTGLGLLLLGIAVFAVINRKL